MQYDSYIHNFPYFSQNDERWNGQRYGGGNIGTSGCGPTSAAMILKSFGNNVTPADTARAFVSYIGYQTTNGSCFPRIAKAYGLSCVNSTNINTVVQALKEGKPVIANPHGPEKGGVSNDFTKRGHYIVLCGLTNDGKIYVNDPNGNHYDISKTNTYTPEYIQKCCVNHGCVDGYFIFDKNGSGSIGSAGSSSASVKAKTYTDFPKYSLSQSAMEEIAKIVTREQGGADVLGCRQEASQIANLNEVTYKRGNTEADILKTIRGGWYSSSRAAGSYTKTALEAVKFVLVEGKRVLPRYVTEHDMFPLDAAIAGHWNNGRSEDRSQYKAHSTTIKQNPSRFKGGGASYTFYCFFGSKNDLDVSGYYKKDYEKYKSDIPWTEGAEEYAYGENSYTDGTAEPTVVWNNRTKECIHKRLIDMPVPEIKDGLRLYAEGVDVTDYMGNLSWKNSVRELATTMSFECAKSDAQYIKELIYLPQVGDIVQMTTNGEVFRGVVLKCDDGDRDSNKYTAADLGWYLNKTAQTYQFKNISGKKAIEEVCEDVGVPIVMIPDLDTPIDQIYFDKAVSEVIYDVLERCGGGYTFDFVPNGIRIYKIGGLSAYPEFSIAPNLPQDYSVSYRGNVSHSTSMENMKNSIKITSEKDNVYKELLVKQNRELIDKYGFLQQIIKIDEEKENAQERADLNLSESGVIDETFSFEIIEKYDSYTRAGESIEIDGVKYSINSTDHSYSNGRQTTKLEVAKA